MQQPDYSIATPENVDLHLELAGIGNRVLACLVDSTITYAAMFATGMLMWGCLSILDLTDAEGMMRTAITAVLWASVIFILFVIMFGYYIFFEGIWQGQTPGKKLTGIRVVEATGQPVGWSGVIIRNLIRIFDQGVAFIGLLPMLADKKERRFGDFAANTIVIRERKPLLQAGDAVTQSSSTMIDAGRLTPQEYDLIVSFLKRRESLAAQHRPMVAEKLAAYMREKVGGESLSTITNETLLENLYTAYKARAEN